MTRMTAFAIGLLTATAFVSPVMAQDAAPKAPAQTTDAMMTRNTTYHSETRYEWNSGKKTRDFYLAGQAGGSFPASGDLENDGVYGLAAGWYVNDNIRMELEGAYRTNDFETGGRSDTWNTMLNAYWDFHNSSSITPYLGFGAGWAFNKLKDTASDDKDNGFTYQAIAGASIDMTDSLALTVDYRFVDTDKFKYTAGDFDYRAHEVHGGLRYSF